MKRLQQIVNSLSFRLIFWTGLILFVSIALWAYFQIRFQKEKALENASTSADRLSTTIQLGAHYAMMLNSRQDLMEITRNVARQKGIENIRIYNKQGEIKFSNNIAELDQTTNIKAEACHICHKQEPPLVTLGLNQRTRLFETPNGERKIGVISPIYNEEGCSAGSCHVHPKEKKVLGLLDMVVSLEDMEREILAYEKALIGLAVFLFLGSALIIGVFLLRFVNRPIRQMVAGVGLMGLGDYNHVLRIDRDDELGFLAASINQMCQEVREKHEELKQNWEEYQMLFERAPCYITVQDRDLRLIRYNQEFAARFLPENGAYCYRAYKRRDKMCDICPVMLTFRDGVSHVSEEAAVLADGTEAYWMVRTSPIKNAKGEVIAAMEMCLDLTHVRALEREARRSEEKYRTIFNTIPNPVFVLGEEGLKILDCNDSVVAVYGYSKEEVLMTPFLDLFEQDERNERGQQLRTANIINRARQVRKDGKTIFVNMRIASSDYAGRKALLVTTSDITMRLLAEQQLIQASKMATLGEMATGVAHELNQPLSVIKTASSFLRRKAGRKETISDDVLETMTEEIDSHVDRASKIISHMREFGRKAEVKKERVDANQVLKNALELFSQQLRLREIEVVMELQADLPPVLADANRLEQVFINLIINARDSIESKWEQGNHRPMTKRILLRTAAKDGFVTIEVADTGTGIPEAIQERIFEPFFTTKRVGKGTGLGLSITYGIVQDYDGLIRVETREGEGSTFIVQFPVPEEA